MTRNISATLIAFCALGVSSTALGHDLFIKPDNYHLDTGETVSIPLMNGTFVESEGGLSPDRVRNFSVATVRGWGPLNPESIKTDGNTSRFPFLPNLAGVHVIGLSLKPNDITLSAEDFDNYLEHDGIPDVLAARREAGATGDVHEIYEKHVKTVVRVGGGSTGPYDEVFGYPAEIILQNNPFKLSAGDEIRFKCLVDRKPAVNQFVLLGGEKAGGLLEEVSVRTDEKGEGSFTLDSAGKKYLRFIHMRESPKDGVDYHSKWATVTFEIPGDG